MKLSKEKLSALHDILTRPSFDDFKDLGGIVYTSPHDPKHECLWIRSNPDSKVVAVAHLDTVKFTYSPEIYPDCSRIRAGQLDDRLGAWVILSVLHDVLPKDLPYDIVLTNYEERGQSTGILFKPPEGKQYNWMFEFDRRGTDVVMYEYETPVYKKLLESYNFEVGKGSFTDICVMDQLNCAGFNFGTGYHKEHTDDCYADLDDLAGNLGKFIKFYKDNYYTHFPSDSDKVARRRSWKTDYLYPSKWNYQSGRSVGSGNTQVASAPTTKGELKKAINDLPFTETT